MCIERLYIVEYIVALIEPKTTASNISVRKYNKLVLFIIKPSYLKVLLMVLEKVLSKAWISAKRLQHTNYVYNTKSLLLIGH